MRLTKRSIVRAVAAGIAAAAMAAAYVAAQPAAPSEQVIRIVAKKFEYVPAEITLKNNVPVILELTTTDDVIMGFKVPGLGVREDVVPGKTTRIRVAPTKAGKFDIVCDVFCGSGHEDMEGMITVVD
jgi:cytochrome c oxidase subunit 2